jgi:predicted nuclease with TOPRIM domain
MGQMKKAKNEVIFFDSDSDSYSNFKPTYKDLQDSIEEMHVESLNAFEKLMAQKKTILKLESEISKLKEAFESLRDEHALLVNEKIVSPTIESPKTKSPKYDNWMDFVSCEICPSLHEEINFLNKKLERVSKGTMTFAMNSKDERTPFKDLTPNIG